MEERINAWRLGRSGAAPVHDRGWVTIVRTRFETGGLALKPRDLGDDRGYTVTSSST